MFDVAVRHGVPVAKLVVRGMPIGEQHVVMGLVAFDVIHRHLPGMIAWIQGHGNRMPVGERTDDLDALQVMIVTVRRAIAKHL